MPCLRQQGINKVTGTRAGLDDWIGFVEKNEINQSIIK